MHGPEIACIRMPVSRRNGRERAFLKSLHKTALMLEDCLEAHEALFEALYPTQSCSSLTARLMRRRLGKLQLTIARLESGHVGMPLKL